MTITVPPTWTHIWHNGVTADQVLTRLDPAVLLTRTLMWVNATRPRRWIVWSQLALHTWVVLTTWLAPQAAASTQVTAAAAVGWMNLQDEDGVPVSAYMFSTDHGSLWHPTNLPLSSILQSEFGIWLMVVSFGVWFVCWAMSFNWLNLFSNSLIAVSNALTQTISTPAIIAAAVAVGSVPIAWYFLRGHTSKAVAQLCMVLVVAILGGTVLGNPIGKIIGPDGLLAQGRDTGIAISTSISGQPSNDGAAMIEQLQRQLTTTFIRQPLQQWNFGAVVDEQSPTCRAAWSSGQMSGKEDQVKDRVNDCGADASHAMKHVADNPSGSQIGTGAVLILFSFLLLAFACYLGFRIIITAFQAIWAGFKVIVGFAITGFIPGAGQTALWNSFVDMILCAVAMTMFVVFLGGWSIILRSLLSSNNLSGAAGITVAGIAMIVAIVLLWRTRTTRERTAQKVAANLSSLGGSPTPTAQPVGPSALSHALTAAQTVTTLTQGSAVNKIRNLTESTALPPDRDPAHDQSTDSTKSKRGAVRSLAPIAVEAAAAAATGGASAAASAAARTAGRQATTAAAGKAVRSATRSHTTPDVDDDISSADHAASHSSSAPAPAADRPPRNPAPQPHTPAPVGTGYATAVTSPTTGRGGQPSAPGRPSTAPTHVMPQAVDDPPPPARERADNPPRQAEPDHTSNPPPHPQPHSKPSTQTTHPIAAPAPPPPHPVPSPWRQRHAAPAHSRPESPPAPHVRPDHHLPQDS